MENVKQVLLCEQSKCVIVLTHQVNICPYNSLQTTTVLEKGQGVCILASIAKNSIDLLACGSRRGVKIYSLSHSSVTFLENISLVSTPHTMSFLSLTEMCVGSMAEVSYIKLGEHKPSHRLFSIPQFSMISSNRPIHLTCNYTETSIIVSHAKSCFLVEFPTNLSSKLLFEWSFTPETISIHNL
jgi:hypothetical protein